MSREEERATLTVWVNLPTRMEIEIKPDGTYDPENPDFKIVRTVSRWTPSQLPAPDVIASAFDGDEGFLDRCAEAWEARAAR